jgi:hypothetical protein
MGSDVELPVALGEGLLDGDVVLPAVLVDADVVLPAVLVDADVVLATLLPVNEEDFFGVRQRQLQFESFNAQ